MKKELSQFEIRELRRAFYESRLLSELRNAESNYDSGQVIDGHGAVNSYWLVEAELLKCLLKQPYEIDYTVECLKKFLDRFFSWTEKRLSEMGLPADYEGKCNKSTEEES